MVLETTASMSDINHCQFRGSTSAGTVPVQMKRVCGHRRVAIPVKHCGRDHPLALLPG